MTGQVDDGSAGNNPAYLAASALLVRVNPFVRRDFARLGKPDHSNWRLVAPRAARSAPKRRLQFPYRGVTRPSYRIQRQASAGLAAAAFNLQPAVTAIDALANRWGRLRWPAIALHADGPCFRFGTIRFAGGFPSLLAGMLGMYVGPHNPRTPYRLA